MVKVTVLVVINGEDKLIDSYFPNELAAMFTSHGYIAWVLPEYLKNQAI